MQRCLWVVLFALGACFSPKFNDGAITCGPDDLCPPGLECSAGVCRAEAVPFDAAPDSPGMVALTLVRTGTGMGDVTSVPAGVNCGATCVGTYPAGTMVTLTAAPLSGSTFTRWSGACSGSSTTCTLTLSTNMTASADFGQIMRTLTVIPGGNGTGAITSSVGGINCPGLCTIQVPDQSQVVLTAAPTGSSTFLGWSAASLCSGTGTCDFKITADTTVTGSFALDYSVLVDKNGTGTGTVVSTTPANGINCGNDCTEVYPVNTVVTLDATATSNSSFRGWSGACSGMGPCVVTVTAAVMVTATFDLMQHPLSVGFAGNGTGAVTSNPGGINCPGACSEIYDSGTMVTLTAAADSGSTFMGWSGPTCSGTGPCTVTVTMMSAVTATFVLTQHKLSVIKDGNGAGSVTSGGLINCGTVCTEVVNEGTVLLTATPATGSVFTGWSAAGCGTLPMCSVSVAAETTVTATFTLTTQMLSVSVAGTGTVSSTPTGIVNCDGAAGSACDASFDYNTMVTLTPTPGAGSSFSTWNGACGGSGACVVTMDQTRMVGASFTVNSYPLVVVLSGAGSGLVTSSPPGISCGGGTPDCIESYLYNTDVTLTANANTPSLFVGWSGGGCPASGNTCVVDMLAARNVTAKFSPPPNRMFVTSGTIIPGNLGGLAGADSICQTAATAASLAGTYRAWLSHSTADAVTRLGTASGWIRTDGRPFANDKAEIATGLLFHPPRVSENGVDLFDLSVVTGTYNGVYNTNDGDCGLYTSQVGSVTSGISSSASEMFSAYGSTGCNQPAHLYCFGIDRQSTVIQPPPPTGFRRAFMRLWTPGAGLADADAACQADATLAGLPGTFLALLPTSTASALSRFNLAGRPWLRTDNVSVLPTAAMWATATFFDSGPNRSANGTISWGNYVHWSGAPNLSTAGTNATTCESWTKPALTATYGIAGQTRLTAFTNNSSNIMCDFASGTITCLEQ